MTAQARAEYLKNMKVAVLWKDLEQTETGDLRLVLKRQAVHLRAPLKRSENMLCPECDSRLLRLGPSEYYCTSPKCKHYGPDSIIRR